MRRSERGPVLVCRTRAARLLRAGSAQEGLCARSLGDAERARLHSARQRWPGWGPAALRNGREVADTKLSHLTRSPGARQGHGASEEVQERPC